MAKREVLAWGKGPENNNGPGSRAHEGRVLVGREASRLEHTLSKNKAEASSGTGPGRPGVAEAGCQAQKARAGRAWALKRRLLSG